ncbi:MAG: rhodanese-like domain-containing protein [Bacillota bacterium]
MKNFFKGMSTNKKLGITALALGLIAVFGANPYNHTYTSLNTKDVAYTVDKRSNRIEASELADWIIKEKADYKLIDLRSEKEYNEYHIPGALNVKTAELEAAGLQRPEKIVLYSENEMSAAQSWFLLRAKDYKAVYVLSGGISSWKENVLFPKLSAEASKEEAASFEKIKQVSLYFGGTPQTGLGNEESKPQITMPKLTAPAAVKVTAQRKKKEGC